MIPRKQKSIIVCLILAYIVLTPFMVEAKYRVSCRSAIFSDRTKVVRLYGKNVHQKVLPASTTKVMTALVVLKKLPLDKYITVSHRGTLPQPTKLYLKKGEKYKVRDLLHAILLKSANDAAVVLAEAVSGTEWKFVQEMNKMSLKIGAKHTKFANSSGLPSKAKQYTTAYDMYLIFREAMKYDFFREVIKKKYATIYSKNGRKISLKSHNKMLFMGYKRNIYGKTGYTRSAGKCFVGTLQKGKSMLIMALFNCPNRWEDARQLVSRYAGLSI